MGSGFRRFPKLRGPLEFKGCACVGLAGVKGLGPWKVWILGIRVSSWALVLCGLGNREP